MTDKTEHEINRAHRAQALLNDPLMKEAREHIEAELWRLFKTVVPTDADSLAQIKGMQYMHDKYTSFLSKVINDGKKAQFELEQKKKTLRERVFG